MEGWMGETQTVEERSLTHRRGGKGRSCFRGLIATLPPLLPSSPPPASEKSCRHLRLFFPLTVYSSIKSATNLIKSNSQHLDTILELNIKAIICHVFFSSNVT
ncbi:Hypothetical predicted protein [Xyrichtys novacula]|uniref:Uncharacterized protein n=1 Tax=Xyrichtys novacula TaxID=13765 RepID=A0AAV1GWH5_XYRNO|nr:Hypothetical predicted protein [Xyrichtys novacula]